jgi:hypothetical protein
MKSVNHLASVFVPLSILLSSLPASAQGTRADCERAARFLTGDLERMVQPADILTNWIEGTDQFWYWKPWPDTEFLLVDSAKNTSGPAFDQSKLAEELSKATGKRVRANHLPFNSFELVGKEEAIRFAAESQPWTCSLSTYNCTNPKPLVRIRGRDLGIVFP